MIVSILTLFTFLTFLIALSLIKHKFSATKIFFQLLSATLFLVSVILTIVTVIASHQTTFLKANSVPVSTHTITKHILSSTQDHIFTLEDGTTLSVPDQSLSTSYTSHPSNTLTIRQGVVDMNPYLPVRYTVEDKFYEFTPPHN